MAAPVTRLALAFTAGATWALLGAPTWLAPPAALLLLAAPKSSSLRPVPRTLWVMAGIAGLVSTIAVSREAQGCGVAVAGPSTVRGRFLASARARSAPFLNEDGCGPFTVVASGTRMPVGRLVSLDGTWREGRLRPWFEARSWSIAGDHDDSWRWRAVRWRDALGKRLDRLYGDRAPLVSALTLARREGLDPDLREAFARVGIAHLLAISGFHVGVIAGVLLSALIALGVRKRPAAAGAAFGSWVYVGFIGFPDAACRAALILTAAALSRARGRPAPRWGAIGAALLLLLAVDPHRLATPGFQLSFAGAAGLTAWAGPLSRAIGRRAGRAVPVAMTMALSAGAAATLATLPIAAWHFERVSLVGIPVTLVATPLVTLGLLGALGSIALDFASPELAAVLAGGVSTVLAGLERLAMVGSSLSWASAWTTRGTVVGGAMGLLAGWWTARKPRVGLRARRILTGLYVAVAVTAWPLLLALQGRGSVEIMMIDVGQGDAIALRGPRGRWILVDSGPPVDGTDAGGHPVVRALRARGVRRLEALILTHPDLDHIGGATAVLESFDVGVVYDPGIPAGRQAFVDVLQAATEHAVPWRAARAGDRIDLDRLAIRVLHPPEGLGTDVESNASSVVLLASFGDFDALLTGDAYKDVERLIAAGLGDVVEVLKVGHHGSDTSTDALLLDVLRPEVALVSVGRNNRYGHPASDVLRRLDARGVRVRRTDREGHVRVLARPDGSLSVTSHR